MTTAKQINPNFDWLKYAMSILIVMIHTGYSSQVIITRLAVPVFFVLSAYFFFKKLRGLDRAESRMVYLAFLKRSALLYAFWFVVLLPVTIIARGWLDMTPGEFVGSLVSGVLFKSTFLASWYISAYVIGISLAYALRRHTALFIVLGTLCYVVCCLTSNYYGLIENTPLATMLDSYRPFNSFPAGLLFIGIGKLIAQRGSAGAGLSALILAAGVVLLFVENHIIDVLGCRSENECYFSAILAAPGAVMLARALPPLRLMADTSPLRKLSVIYYCSHFSLLFIIEYHILQNMDKGVYLAVVLCVATLLGAAIIRLSATKRFRWLRYAY